LHRYIAIRILSTIPTLLMVSFLVFAVLRLVPGDPVRLMYGMTPPPEAEIAKLRHEMGLDRSMVMQYVTFMGRLAKGDMGRSYNSRQPVAEMIVERLPKTLKLAGLSLVLAAVAGITLGVLAAAHRGSLLDMTALVAAVAGVTFPSFWVAIMMILLFSVKLRWFPVAGSSTFKHMVLPALTMAFGGLAVLVRITRASMVEVLDQDFIKTARAKGLSERVVHYRHALRNALIPVITILGLQVGGIMSGALLVETVFGYAGMGQLAVYALNTRDYPVVQGVVLLTATGYVLVNTMVDLVYATVDPRIKYR
jgi:peptide/nickel transport system permease protein